MKPERYQQLKEMLIPAMELSNDELAAYLDEHCGEDPELRAELESLLSLSLGDTFLEQAPVQITPSTELKDHIGRIKIDHLLASGGMGNVYSGTDELLGRPVAVKVLHEGLRLSASRRTGFLNEAKLLSSLQHPNICQIFDFFEDQDRDVIVLELIDGVTMRNKLKQGPLREANRWLLQLATAMQAAHERGISHHDLKPENIMIDASKTLKVLDFGLAQSEGSRVEGEGKAVSGTPAYMSPEQAKGESAGSASDIYGMGLIMVEAWTGQAALTVDSLLQHEGPNLQLLKQLPVAEQKLLRQMWAENPAERPTARQVSEQLKHILQRPTRRLKWLAAAGVLVLTGLSFWKYTHDLQTERNLALEARDEAVQARTDAEGLIAFMMDDLQKELRAVGKLNLLQSVANQTMNYYGELDPELMVATRGKPAVALAQVGEVFDYQGDKAKAIAVFTQAVAALEKLYAQQPADALVRYHLANTLTQLGENQKLNGDFEQAHASLETALNHGQALLEGLAPGLGPDERPDATERWALWLKAHYHEGDVLMRKGQSEQAVESLDRIIATARAATQQNPALQRYLADIEYKLCDTYYDIPVPEKIIEPCLASLAMDQKLHQANPENYRLHANYAVGLQAAGRAFEINERHQEALQYQEQSVAEFLQLHEWEPNDASRKNDLVGSTLTKAKILLALGRDDEAMADLRQAEAMAMTLVEEKQEITVLNNTFAIKLLLGKIEEARPIAAVLHAQGFRRREFGDLCEQYAIKECLD